MATNITARDLFDLVIRAIGEAADFAPGVSADREAVEARVLEALGDRQEDEAYLRRRIGFAHRNQREGYCGASREPLTTLVGESRPFGWGLTEAGVEKARELAAAVKPAVCAWTECGEPARVNSIYCSRSCSNNNARARHAARQAARAAQA